MLPSLTKPLTSGRSADMSKIENLDICFSLSALVTCAKLRILKFGNLIVPATPCYNRTGRSLLVAQPGFLAMGVGRIGLGYRQVEKFNDDMQRKD